MDTNRIMFQKIFWKSFAGILLLLFLFASHADAQVPATTSKARVVISPYAQAVPNNSYTFISVSHPSLDSALTQIGLWSSLR